MRMLAREIAMDDPTYLNDTWLDEMRADFERVREETRRRDRISHIWVRAVIVLYIAVLVLALVCK